MASGVRVHCRFAVEHRESENVEMEIKVTINIDDVTSRMPYAQMRSVEDQVCCYSIASMVRRPVGDAPKR